jgi:ArsR family transcriptional regulator, arsenate/arsenite/antimonite-responsive transcriptional repressor
MNVNMGSLSDRSIDVNMYFGGSMAKVGRAETPTGCRPIPASQLSEAEATELAALFAALSDPVRLRLLSIVASEGEVCSCNLEGPLGKSQPTISHHTKVLADAGLIVGERRGRWTWWSAVPEVIERLREPPLGFVFGDAASGRWPQIPLRHSR